MLVLSRQIGERLIIDGQIKVTVVEIRPDRVKLGVSAPPEISVHREEVYRRITAAVASHCVDQGTDESRYMAEFA